MVRPGMARTGGPRWQWLTRVSLVWTLCTGTVTTDGQPMANPVDLAGLQLRAQGDGMEDDSVAMAVVAAAHLLGKEADVGVVSCQLANAFAPSIDLGEDCTSHWHVCAWHAVAGLPAVRRRLGLRIEPLALLNGNWADTTTGPATSRRDCARVLAAAMARGQIILTPGGWEVGLEPRGPHGFVHWGYMGIVTRADTATGVLLGAHLNGFTDNPLGCPDQVWTVGPGTAPVPTHQADVEMLRLAIDRIRGQGAFAPTPRVVNGLAAMDAWIRQMRTVPGFCAPCSGRAGARIGDAANNARRTVAGCTAAAGQLRRIARAEPRATTLLAKAAGRYDQIAHLLSPALEGPVEGRYAAFAGDLLRQQQHADAVLLPIRAELAAAADELEQTLAAMAVRRDDGGVRIEGLPAAPGDGNGYVRGLEAMLTHQGAPVAYDRLMAWSGLAFIAQADTGHRWEGKVDVGWWPLDPWGLVLRLPFLSRAVGFQLLPVGAVDPSVDQATAVREDAPGWYRTQVQPALHRALDAGQPVLGLNDFGYVISGYDSVGDPAPVYGRCARDVQAVAERSPGWPCAVITLGARTAAMDSRAADIGALRFAVALARDQAGPATPAWHDRRYTGHRAFAAWADLLRDETEPVEDRHHANMRGRLLDSRQAAARYLDDLANGTTGPASATLHEAAAAYRDVAEALWRLAPEGLAQGMDRRRAAADGIDSAAVLEEHAVACLERAIPLLSERHAADGTDTDTPDVGE